MKKISWPISQRNSLQLKKGLGMVLHSRALQHQYSDPLPEKALNKTMQKMMKMTEEHQISLMRFRNLSRRHRNRHLMLRKRCLK